MANLDPATSRLNYEQLLRAVILLKCHEVKRPFQSDGFCIFVFIGPRSDLAGPIIVYPYISDWQTDSLTVLMIWPLPMESNIAEYAEYVKYVKYAE